MEFDIEKYCLSDQLISFDLMKLIRLKKSSVFWDGLNEQGQKVPSGIYIYQIEADSLTKSKRMVIVR